MSEEAEMPSGEDVEQAAVKIQALQRGRQAREEMRAKSNPDPTDAGGEQQQENGDGGEAGDQVGEMPTGEDVEQAAVKIQAIARGRQTRKEMSDKQPGQGAEPAAAAAEEEMPSGEDVENAAVKIQALQRGRKTRAEMSKTSAGEAEGGDQVGDLPGPPAGSDGGAPLQRQWTEKEKSAATKIQSLARGRQTRHILSNNDLDAARDVFAARQAMRDRHMEASTLARHHNQAEGDVVTLMANKKVLEEAHHYSKKKKDEAELAAVQMQSLYRGFRDRKAVRRVREEAEASGRAAMHRKQLDSAHKAQQAADIQGRFHGYSAAGSIKYVGHGPSRSAQPSTGSRKAAVATPTAKKEQAPTLVDKKAIMSDLQKRACGVIEDIIKKWATSYARAVELRPGAESTGALEFVGLFSKPSKEEPIAWPVVRVHFNVPEDFQTALVPRVTYSLEGERMVYDVTTDLGRRFKESWLDRIVMDKRAIRADMALRTKR